jgi:hypothetical protein
MPTNFMTRAVWVAAGVATVLLAGVAQAAGVPGQGTWETTLQPRDLNGDKVAAAFYDTDLKLTWLRDANVNWSMNWETAVVGWADGFSLGG